MIQTSDPSVIPIELGLSKTILIGCSEEQQNVFV
jgi:hypothetical protein